MNKSLSKSMFERFFAKFPMKNEDSPEDEDARVCKRNLECTSREKDIFTEGIHELDGDKAVESPGK